MIAPIEISSVEKEGLLRTSRPLKHAVLLSLEEMKALLEEIGEHFLIPASGTLDGMSWSVQDAQFLSRYEEYLKWMSQEPTLPPPPLRRFFSLMLSNSLNCFYQTPISPEKFCIKPKLPVVQIQLYHCFFSSFDHQLRSMVLSPESFAWGLQIAYPQIYEDPKTHQFSKVLLDSTFSNSLLFKKIVSWLRSHTQVFSLKEGFEKTQASFRIGKTSLHLKDVHQGLQQLLAKNRTGSYAG
jgi:hypothetical protein